MTTSPYYPLNPSGPLCPLLNDPDLLLEFYEHAQLRKALKKFCKQNRWEGKPPMSYSMGNESLKKLLASLLGTPAARARLLEKDKASDESPALHQAIWGWVSFSNAGLLELVGDHSHEVGDRVFMSADELNGLIKAADEKELLNEDGTRHLACLATAFAMLQPDDAAALLGTFCKHFPAYKERLGTG